MGAGLNLNRHKQMERILLGKVRREPADAGQAAVTFADVDQEKVEDDAITPGIFKYALATSTETMLANADEFPAS